MTLFSCINMAVYLSEYIKILHVERFDRLWYFRRWKQMDTKEFILVNNFLERLPGEAAERAVNIKHILLSYFVQKSGGTFLLCIPTFISVLLFFFFR